MRSGVVDEERVRRGVEEERVRSGVEKKKKMEVKCQANLAERQVDRNQVIMFATQRVVCYPARWA